MVNIASSPAGALLGVRLRVVRSPFRTMQDVRVGSGEALC